MVSGFRAECPADRKAAADAGTVFSAIYAALIFIVYFAQTTTVRLDRLEGQAALILDFRRGGLLFSYDLLGYGMMALSTFFVGLSMRAQNRADKWLKYLLMIHGAFFAGCFVMPMTGMFSGMIWDESHACPEGAYRARSAHRTRQGISKIPPGIYWKTAASFWPSSP